MIKLKDLLFEETDFQRAMNVPSGFHFVGTDKISVKNTLSKHSLGDRVKIVKSIWTQFSRNKIPGGGTGVPAAKRLKPTSSVTYNVYIDEKFIGSGRNLNSAVRTAQRKLNRMTEVRDYKDEYKKFQSSKKMKKYRAELNKYNRQKGTYGNNDKKDASHKSGKIKGFEAESKNRGRREKSRLKKEGTRINLTEKMIKSLGPFKSHADETDAKYGFIFRHYLDDKPGWGNISVWIQKMDNRKYRVGMSLRGEIRRSRNTTSFTHATIMAQGMIEDLML